MNSISEKLYFEQASIESVNTFFEQFQVGCALKRANIYKSKGIPAVSVMKYLICLVFTGKSMFQDMRSKSPLAAGFSKDVVYRLMRLTTVNWRTLLLTIAASTTCFMDHLTSDQRLSAFVIDDTMYHRPHSRKTELSSRVFDHADNNHRFKIGFRMLTLVWTDGVSVVPLAFRHLASKDQKNRYSESNQGIDKRTCGGRIRKEAVTSAPEVMLAMLSAVLRYNIPARHVLFDCWFAFPAAITKIKELGLKTVCRVKKSSKIKYLYENEKCTLTQIYNANKKRRGKSRYLLSVEITVYDKDGDSLPARLVYIRDRNNRKNWIALLSTDMDLSETEIICLYGKRWNIEVFFKMCKSYLKLTGEFRQLSYDAVTAHTTIVMLRYMMLAVEKRRNSDPRSLAELFFEIYDEADDIRFEQAFYLIMQLLQSILLNPFIGLSSEQIDMIKTEFILGLPSHLKNALAPTFAAASCLN